MSESIRVVARFSDGRMLKGTTQDFLPNRPLFHLIRASDNATVDVHCKDLKAVFFVRTLEGNPGRQRLQGFVDAPATTAQGRKVAVLFKDGELLCGYTLTYQAGRDGFFLFPVDESGNNMRAYVMVASAAEVKVGPAAEALAMRVLGERKK